MLMLEQIEVAKEEEKANLYLESNEGVVIDIIVVVVVRRVIVIVQQ